MIQSRHILPEGLPACVAGGKNRLKKLQELLGLSNRKDWQPILHSETVKSYLRDKTLELRGLSTSQRIARKVIVFYGQPDARREIWELYCPLAPDIRPVSERHYVPSLEYAAIKHYDPSLFEHEIDIDLVEQSLEGIIGFRHSWRFPEFEVPALAAWPALRKDILRWNAISSDRHEAIVLATFAVATILDDVRILKWAAERTARLEGEFAFAGSASSESMSEPADPESSDNLSASPGTEPALEQWNRTCEQIIDVATNLKSSSPDPDRLGDLLEPVRRLEDLRSQIAAAISIRQREALLGRVTDILTACDGEFGASWLGGIQEGVQALWQLAYREPWSVPDDKVNRDIDRVQDQLKQELRRWRRFEDTKANQREQLFGLEAPDGADFQVQMEAEAREESLHAGIAEAVRQATNSKRRILEVVAPAGWTFESSRDYKAELADADALTDSAKKANPSASGQPDVPGHPVPDVDSPPRSETGGGGPAPASETVAAKPPADCDLNDSGRSGLDQPLGTKAVEPPAESQPMSSPVNAVARSAVWTGGWEAWLERIGDSTHPESVLPWNLAEVPNCPATSSFRDPHGFAKSLAQKLKCGLIERPRDTLLALVEYLNSDPMKGRQEWKVIYLAILDHGLRENLDPKDSRAIAFSLISMILKANPSNGEYLRLVNTADQLTAQQATLPHVKWALELSVPFLLNRCANREHLAIYLETIDRYVSESGFHLASKHQEMLNDIRKFLDASSDDAARASLASESAQDSKELSKFLKGKRIVIYSLQRPAALTARDRIQAIESSAEVRLFHDKVWSDSLQDPIRNADLCVMVSSAATHAVTEMISRTRRNAGKELIVPAWKGVHSLLRSIYDAAGIDGDSAAGFESQGAGGVA